MKNNNDNSYLIICVVWEILINFVHTLKYISRRPPTYLDLQLLLRQVTYQNVATLRTDTRNSVLHCEIRTHTFPENFTSN
jgi:hypothetical protein